MRKGLVLAALLALVVAALPAAALGLGFSTAVSDEQSVSPPSALAERIVPTPALRVEIAAAQACPGLPWQILPAANLETDPTVFRHIDLVTGVVSAAVRTSTAGGGLGPFAFSEATWHAYATTWPGDPSGAAPDPDNDYDATYTLAQALCDLSADDTAVAQVLAQYDSSPAFDSDVFERAIALGMNPDGSTEDSGAPRSSLGAVAPGSPPPAGATSWPIYEPPGPVFDGSRAALVAAAETQLGVPYVWGGITAGKALDCSGLVVVSMAAIGFQLLWAYRTSEEQAGLGIAVAPSQVGAGDLLLMAGDDGGAVVPLGHIAIAVNSTEMIEAPYTGEVVQIAPIPWSAIETARQILSLP